MEGRRLRRFGMERGRGHKYNHTLLPLRATAANPLSSSSSSSWYCDYRISALNQPLYRLGRSHYPFFTAWFSVGVGFAITTLLAVSLILFWELARALHIFPHNSFGDLSSASLFGFWPFHSYSVSDAAYLLVSTFLSVCVHEFGHVLAAASEGIEMKYIAVFIVVLFPGALVAFDYDLLEALPHFASLRVYCAGIWHNAVCCAFCGFALFLLPWILFPFYNHGESPMVLAVSSSSSLSSYLSPGDAIVSLDGTRINSAQEWMEMAALTNKLALQNMNNSISIGNIRRVNSRKGYCVPNSILEVGKKMQGVEDQSGCPDDLAAFMAIPCFNTSMLGEQIHCLNAKEVVKLGKCGDGWVTTKPGSKSCICSQDKFCLSPIQMPDMIWVEVSYSKPYSMECSQLGRKSLSDSGASDLEPNCGGSFVFVGDVISMASSVQLTAYRPRWAYFGFYFPHVLERIFICTFHVSLTLALLNSLPVYFLDGESLLEATLCHFTSLGPNKRHKILRVCLLSGTLISFLTVIRIFLKFL